MKGITFDWHEAKNKANVKKHGSGVSTRTILKIKFDPSMVLEGWRQGLLPPVKTNTTVSSDEGLSGLISIMSANFRY